MKTADDRYVVGADISDAWVGAVALLNTLPTRKAVHLLVRVMDPATENANIHRRAQALIDTWNEAHPKRSMPDVVSTRNSIFPAAFAARTDGPEALAEYYRARLNKAGLLGFRGNERGTYFGRIVAYPRADGSLGDQLSETVRKLRQELAGAAPKSSRYEINIYNEKLDTSPMSFPCLAHASFHLHMSRVHLQAVYRNECLVARGYGNYLGLAQLQCYVAEAAGTGVGELLITAGHAELDGQTTETRRMLSELDAL